MTKLTNKVITIFNRKTSMRLTTHEWNILDSICHSEKIKRKTLLEHIQNGKDQHIGLTSAVRLFSLLYIYLNNKHSGNSRKINDIIIMMRK